MAGANQNAGAVSTGEKVLVFLVHLMDDLAALITEHSPRTTVYVLQCEQVIKH
jgi:hypothetical protein